MCVFLVLYPNKSTFLPFHYFSVMKAKNVPFAKALGLGSCVAVHEEHHATLPSSNACSLYQGGSLYEVHVHCFMTKVCDYCAVLYQCTIHVIV